MNYFLILILDFPLLCTWHLCIVIFFMLKYLYGNIELIGNWFLYNWHFHPPCRLSSKIASPDSARSVAKDLLKQCPEHCTKTNNLDFTLTVTVIDEKTFLCYFVGAYFRVMINMNQIQSLLNLLHVNTKLLFLLVFGSDRFTIKIESICSIFSFWRLSLWHAFAMPNITANHNKNFKYDEQKRTKLRTYFFKFSTGSPVFLLEIYKSVA